MAVEQVYRCDVCGEYIHKDALYMFEVRRSNDEPVRVDLGPECVSRHTLFEVLKHVVEAAQ